MSKIPFFGGYQYYDTPKGQDIVYKAIYMSKFAAATGLVAATYDVLMYTKPKGVVQTFGRYGYHVGPLVGAAAVFAAVSNISCNLRGKDDKLNYFLGGFASGSIIGAWQKSGVVGFSMGIILGAIGVVKKLSFEEGWVFFPEFKRAESAAQKRMDFTFTAERPKTWSTE